MGQFRRRERGGGRQFQQAAPKPFAFVSLPARVDRKRPLGHDQYYTNRLSGQVQGVIEALSPIHIGSGIIDLGQRCGTHQNSRKNEWKSGNSRKLTQGSYSECG